MAPIIYKLVTDHQGMTKGVELWQGDQHITLSLEVEGLHKTGFKWVEIKETLDALAKERLIKVQQSALGPIEQHIKEIASGKADT